MIAFQTSMDRFSLIHSLFGSGAGSCRISIAPLEGEDKRLREVDVDLVKHVKPLRVAGGISCSVETYFFTGVDDCDREIRATYDFIRGEGSFQARRIVRD